MNTPNEHVRYSSDPARPGATASAVAMSSESAVSWGAILAGAAASAALSLILLILGMGLGLSSVSPWAYEGVSAETFGWATIIWISATSIISAGLGGYIAGRLRTKWVSIHRDEATFRDTAHGFLSWAVSTLLTAALLTSAIGSILGAGAKAGASIAGTAASTAAAGGLAMAGAATDDDASRSEMVDYFVDALFRPDPDAPAAAQPNRTQSVPTTPAGVSPDAAANENQPPADMAWQSPPPRRTTPSPMGAAQDDSATRTEIGRIVMNSLRTGSLSDSDERYVARRIAEHTGMSTEQAQNRLSEIQTQLQTTLQNAETTAREAADTARKASAYASMWLFITLLMAAFSAALFAIFGGRQRDL